MDIIRRVDEIVASSLGVLPEDLHTGNRTRAVEDAKHFSWFFLRSFFGVDAVSLADAYSTTRRNVYYGCALVRDGVRNHPFYILYYTEIEAKLNRAGLKTEKFSPIRIKATFTKLEEDAILPKLSSKGFSIALISRKLLPTGEIVYGTGLSVDIPLGFIGLLFTRNNMRPTHKTKTPVSILEPGISPELKVSFPPEEDDFLRGKEKGSRIAQLVMVQIPMI